MTDAAEPVPVPSRSAVVAVALAWAVPGLGHLYLGRRRRGLIYLAVLAVMFGTGLALEGGLSRPDSPTYLATLATVADLGNGLAYVIAQLMHWGAGRPASATHEAGNAFHWSSGVMNMLLVLDAWDTATGRGRNRAEAA